MDERLGTGVHRDTVPTQVMQEGVRHVLVLEGEDVGALDQGTDRGVVVRRTDRCVRHDLRRGGVRRLDQHPQMHSQRHRCGCHHPGELTAAHHRHHRSCHNL